MLSRLFKAYKNKLFFTTPQEMTQYEKDVNATYRRLFTTDDGKFVLEHLVSTQMARPIAQKGDELLDIGEKQGRSNLVDEIIQRVDKA